MHTAYGREPVNETMPTNTPPALVFSSAILNIIKRYYSTTRRFHGSEPQVYSSPYGGNWFFKLSSKRQCGPPWVTPRRTKSKHEFIHMFPSRGDRFLHIRALYIPLGLSGLAVETSVHCLNILRE